MGSLPLSPIVHESGGALESSNGETSCPEGQSCFADTACNILLMPPTLEPTSSSPTPLPYDHISNTAFCGSDYMDATNKCSIETHCQSMSNEACGSGSFCWAGVTCNVMDMYTLSPTIDSIKPTMSPIDSQIYSQSPTIDVGKIRLWIAVRVVCLRIDYTDTNPNQLDLMSHLSYAFSC